MSDFKGELTNLIWKYRDRGVSLDELLSELEAQMDMLREEDED